MRPARPETCAFQHPVVTGAITHPQPMLAMKLGHEAGMRRRASLLNQGIDYGGMRAAGTHATDKLLVREAARIWEAYLKSPP